MTKLFHTVLNADDTGSPVGELTLTADGEHLTGLYMTDQRRPLDIAPGSREDRTPFDDVVAELREYFSGRRRGFDVALCPEGTQFQLRVWAALCDIPYGTTTSYGAIAKTVGAPGAARAVGAANGRNPISIIVPCHRVIGASGNLTGYGGGLERKHKLLDLEAGSPQLV
ncbi:MAG: methylated-DNA--[protein]-cysteine S-methyltransferase [Acidimicrobiales bacterium]